jgi:hypothetical protein
MTVDRLERQLPQILTELATPSVPDYFDDILGQTARVAQRPGWTFPERWLTVDFPVQRPALLPQVPWRTIAIIALLAALAAAIIAVGSRQRLPAPFGPASNGSLIYERDGDIYIADADATHESLLIGGDSHDFSPIWSRDGTTVLFGRTFQGGTVVMAANSVGGSIRQVSPVTIQVTDGLDVSPTGTQLALINLHPVAGGRNTLSILDLDGRSPMRDLDIGNIQPARNVAWLPPRGEELVFLGYPGGDMTQIALYRIHPDGSGLRQIAAHHGESVAPEQDEISFQDLSFSDDGRTAAYWTWQPNAVAGRTCSTYLLDLTTGNDRRATFDPSAACELLPKLLSSGNILVERQDSDGVAQLLVAPLHARTPGVFIGPKFHYTTKKGWWLSPDRRLVLFVSMDGATERISIATGTTARTALELPDLGSWQRLAP